MSTSILRDQIDAWVAEGAWPASCPAWVSPASWRRAERHRLGAGLTALAREEGVSMSAARQSVASAVARHRHHLVRERAADPDTPSAGFYRLALGSVATGALLDALAGGGEGGSDIVADRRFLVEGRVVLRATILLRADGAGGVAGRGRLSVKVRP